MAAHMHSSSLTTCAACKHQRKRCIPDCIMRKHFPVSRYDEFKEIHNRFGIGNVRKVIKEVNSEEARKHIVKSIYWEAEMWTKDPIQGPYGYYLKLEQELSQYRRNLWDNNNNHQLLQQQATMQQGIINRLLHPLSDMNIMNHRAYENYNMINDGLVNNNGTDTHLMNTNWGVQDNQDFRVTGGCGGVSSWERPGLPAVDHSRFMMQHDHQAGNIINRRYGVMDPLWVGIGNGRRMGGFESSDYKNNNVSYHPQNMGSRMHEQYPNWAEEIGNSSAGATSSSGDQLLLANMQQITSNTDNISSR